MVIARFQPSTDKRNGTTGRLDNWSSVFASGAALMDPKAYFAQWQQAAAAEATVAEEK